MPEFPILMLPREVQALVVQRVAHNSFQDFYRLRVSCKAMRALADEDMVYASFDLFKHPSYFRVRSSLLRRCFREGNPSTLYIKGVEYFFRHERHEEGLALIKSAADAGYERALYTYAMTRKLYYDDEEYLSRFTRSSLAEIGTLVRTQPYWPWEHWPAFVKKREGFISKFIPLFYSCPCSPLNHRRWCHWDIEATKAEDMCKSCFWIKEMSLFIRDFTPSTGFMHFYLWE
ncbi:hypothetical protein Bca4012_082857 [Brassica carinata]